MLVIAVITALGRQSVHHPTDNCLVLFIAVITTLGAHTKTPSSKSFRSRHSGTTRNNYKHYYVGQLNCFVNLRVPLVLTDRGIIITCHMLFIILGDIIALSGGHHP
jgi:hypothetical protein